MPLLKRLAVLTIVGFLLNQFLQGEKFTHPAILAPILLFIGILWNLISKWRDEHIPFSSPESLQLLEKIGEEIAERNRIKTEKSQEIPTPSPSKHPHAPIQENHNIPENIPIPPRRRGLGYLE